jgi:DNA-binding NtrC family response regulator
VAARAGSPARRLSRAAAEKLLAYAWPGNVRELRNAIEHAVALCAGEEIGVEDLPDRTRAYRAESFVLAGPGADELVSLHEIERRYVRHVLEAVGGNRTQAARVLGLDRKTLRRKLGSDA